jgi:hypothetical protein
VAPPFIFQGIACMKEKNPREQLAAFMSKYSPKIMRLANAVIRKMHALVPGATELVYDNYNALVIAFGPGERASEAVFSIALYPRWVNLFFAHGRNVPDPHGLLQGSGKSVRHIVLHDACDLDDPRVRRLMASALRQASVPIDPSARRRLVIRSISAAQRPRRARV